MPDTVFLVDSFFFQQFEYMIPLPSGLQISAEKSTDNLMETPGYVTNHFSPAAFKILLCLCLQTLWVIMYPSVVLFGLSQLEVFEHLYVHFFPQIWKVIHNYFFK